METKHTPGPWDFRTGHTPHFQGQIYDSNGNTIAISYSDESGKNAALIAAAPDLLAALENMLNTYEYPPEHTTGQINLQKWKEQTDKAISNARAALAKAKEA